MAYEILSNPDKREVYDEYGLDAVKHGVGKKKPAGHGSGLWIGTCIVKADQ